MAVNVDNDLAHDIAAPIEVVFDYVADMTNDPHWCPAVDAVEQIEGTGPAVGAVYRVRQILASGDIVPMDLRIEELQRPHRLRWGTDNDLMTYTSTMTLEESGGGTRVRHQTQSLIKPAPEEMAEGVRQQTRDTMQTQLSNLERELAG